MMILGTIEEVSGLYGIPQSTIRRWLIDGRLDRHLPDNQLRPIRVDLNQVDDVLKSIGKGRNRATRQRLDICEHST